MFQDPHRQRRRGYYTPAAIMIIVRGRDSDTELGDGGFTTRTTQLTGNTKERCLVSCISTERLTDLLRQESHPPEIHPKPSRHSQ